MRIRAVCAATVTVGVMTLPAAGVASAATLKLKGPTKIGASSTFRLLAVGTGNHRENYLSFFYTHEPRCAGTYHQASLQPDTFFWESRFVGKSFRVRTDKVKGGAPGWIRFCAYLYPKTSPTATAWAYKRPDAAASHLTAFT